MATFIEGAVTAGASSQDVAEVVVNALRGIEGALKPVIGQRGVAALYRRSLHLARQAHAWLPDVEEGIPATMELGELTATLAGRTSAEACAAGIRLLHAFRALLTSLIGTSLVERLLHPVWITFLSGPSGRGDTSWPAK